MSFALELCIRPVLQTVTCARFCFAHRSMCQLLLCLGLPVALLIALLSALLSVFFQLAFVFVRDTLIGVAPASFNSEQGLLRQC